MTFKPNRKQSVSLLQESLWNRQHKNRGSAGQEGTDLKFAPNDLALTMQGLLPDTATILEIGCANGRDARFFASCKHIVYALDFSQVALDQMMDLAKQQHCDDHLIAIHHDISKALPSLQLPPLDCWYARSSLHLDDENTVALAKEINILLTDDGFVSIEGKGIRDLSIQGSETLGDNLVVNWLEGGHLRRIWTEEFCVWLAQAFSWNTLTLTEVKDELFEKYFLRFIAQKSS